MENTELLQAIETMLDNKLNEKLKPIHEDIKALQDGQKALQKDVKHIKKQIDVVYDWVDGIDIKVKNLEQAI